LEQAVATALEIARRGGAVGRVGVPENDTLSAGVAFWKNVSVGGGTAPARAYIDELLPDVLDGRIDPGRVSDRVTALDEVPEGYRAMNDRETIKVMVELSTALTRKWGQASGLPRCASVPECRMSGAAASFTRRLASRSGR
jgi:threonine dehydrogenase-like Zn-dependent dehydrogenase